MKIVIATLEQLALMSLVFHMREAILFGYKSKQCLGGELKTQDEPAWHDLGSSCGTKPALTWGSRFWLHDTNSIYINSIYFPLLPEILHLDIWSYTSPGDNVLVNVCVCVFVTDQISETALNFQAGGLEEDQNGAL